jgi:hypothetical protein
VNSGMFCPRLPCIPRTRRPDFFLRAGIDNAARILYEQTAMKVLLIFLVWCLLLVLCWQVALLALIVFPLVWLIALPFRLAYVVVAAFFAFIKAVLFLPARLLGYRS